MTTSASPLRSPEVRGLVGVFALLYFVQGACEPTYGLVSQPLRALLLHNGASPGESARFLAWVGLPWILKPLYGPAVDLLPMFGLRRRGWMLLASALATLGFGALALGSGALSPTFSLAALLLLASFGIALGDVAIDALMVERGQALGITGLLQSAQWTASFVGTLAIGWLGGVLTGGRGAFAIAAALSLAGFLLVLAKAHSHAAAAPSSFWEALRAMRAPAILRAAAFLFLLGFNPFHALDYAHVTRDLGLSDAHYGQTVSASAVFGVLACLGYGWLSARVAIAKLAHAAIAGAVLATLGLLWVHDTTSNFVVCALTALAWTFALLLQLDVAARLCPPRYAGTVFALLMGVSNGADALSGYLGGSLYDRLASAHGGNTAYAVLVAIGTAATGMAWLLVPGLAKEQAIPA